MPRREVGRGDAQRALFILADLYTGKRLPQGLPLAPGDPAGLRAAEDLCRPLAETLVQALGRIGGQLTARREHLAHRLQGWPVEVFPHALEQRRAGDPGKGRVGAAGPLQVFGERQLTALETTPGAQGPQHAEQKPVDVLGGDAADDPGRAQSLAPQVLQRVHLTGQLRELLVDALGLAAGPGGAQADAAPGQVQNGRWQGRVEQVVGQRILSLIREPQVYVGIPALACGRLQVGRQQDLNLGPPCTEQGSGQLRGVLQVHRQSANTPRTQATGQAQCLLAQFGMVQDRGLGHLARRIQRQQQVLEVDPVHERPRTRCLISHSRANSTPIAA